MVETAHSLMHENGKKRDEDSEDGLELSPFWGIEKGAVLQEARCFNDSQLDTRRCQQVCTSLMHSIYWTAHFSFTAVTQVITKLLYLCNQGDSFTKVLKTSFRPVFNTIFLEWDHNWRISLDHQFYRRKLQKYFLLSQSSSSQRTLTFVVWFTLL